MSDIETKVEDKYIDHPTHDTFLADCSTCFAENLKMKPSCEVCDGKGYFLKTEWTTDSAGRDMDYEREVKCHCQ